MLNESCLVYERYENTPGSVAQKLFFYPQWCGHFVCGKDFRIERSGYKSILVLYVISGKGILHYRNKTVELLAGTFAVINCMQQHVYYPDGEWDFIFLHFYGTQAEEMCDHIYSVADSFVFSDDGIVRNTITDFVSHGKSGEFLPEAMASKMISDILYSVLLNNKADNTFGNVCRYIEQNIKQIDSVSQLAAKFGFSRCYFSTGFKKATGETVHGYILRCRLAYAKNMLVHGDLPISEIAEMAGYDDTSSFIRIFKQHEKVSPLQYRKMWAI